MSYLENPSNKTDAEQTSTAWDTPLQRVRDAVKQKTESTISQFSEFAVESSMHKVSWDFNS